MIMLGSAFRTTLFLPTQAAFYAFVSVAIPSFFMTLWAKPTDTKGAILPAVLSYAVPVALSIALMAVCVYMFFYTGTLNGLLGHSYIDPDTLYRFGYPQFESTKAMLDYYAESGISLDERYAEVAARNALLLFVVLAQISQLFFINPICKFFALDGRSQGTSRCSSSPSSSFVSSVSHIMQWILLISHGRSFRSPCSHGNMSLSS